MSLWFFVSLAVIKILGVINVRNDVDLFNDQSTRFRAYKK